MHMYIFLIAIYLTIFIALLVVLGAHPQLSSHSRFALQRRANNGDKHAEILLKRHMLIRDVLSLQRVVAAVFLVLLSVLGMSLFHWSVGFLISLVIALESGALARVPLWQTYSQKLYETYEPYILDFIEKHPRIFQAIRSVSPTPKDMYEIESKEELVEIINQSGEALADEEKKMIINGLSFDHMLVGAVMTPKSLIDAVPQDEVLGPLVLSDLHKTGHSRFPVINGDIDHIVGMLYIQDLLKIDQKSKTRRASETMDKQVYYIHEDQTLQHALAAFLRVHHHLFVVVNEFRETVGLLSLEDVIEAFLGRKIVDEFDAHEDLRKVAARNPRKNNRTRSSRDV